MRSIIHSVSTRALVVALLALPAAPAYAYLDPGTGSILVQGLLAAIAGVAVAGRLYWGRIKSFFVKDKPLTTEEPAGTDDVTTESPRRNPD